MGPDKRETQPGYYLTGQVVAAYTKVRLTLLDFGRLAPSCLYEGRMAFLKSLRKMTFSTNFEQSSGGRE
jgi:hypothetical protein